uniref:C-type lectin domain-containing protein n=1 Tax=Amphilophus citrinellus TaxID=61819 RepID=A0A3Q0TBL3_AMPCI
MAFQLRSCWTFLCIVIFLLRNISADPSSRYTLNHTKVRFSEAIKRCSSGVLTTIATQQEVDDILNLISKSVLLEKEFTFWVGLRIKSKCVDLSKPLRGFWWLENNSEESEVSRWVEEPELSCTTSRCAALKGRVDGSNVTWGLIPLPCDKQNNSFIYPLQHATPETTPAPSDPGPKVTTSGPRLVNGSLSSSSLVSDLCQSPSIPEARWITLVPNDGKRIKVECWSSIRFELVCSGEPTVWRLVNGSQANFTAIGIVCANANQKEHHSGLHSSILIPVLIAVGVLVVLLVVIAVTVKCCLKRRSKKRAIKKAEKMELKSKTRKDSFSLA